MLRHCSANEDAEEDDDAADDDDGQVDGERALLEASALQQEVVKGRASVRVRLGLAVDLRLVQEAGGSSLLSRRPCASSRTRPFALQPPTRHDVSTTSTQDCICTEVEW